MRGVGAPTRPRLDEPVATNRSADLDPARSLAPPRGRTPPATTAVVGSAPPATTGVVSTPTVPLPGQLSARCPVAPRRIGQRAESCPTRGAGQPGTAGSGVVTGQPGHRPWADSAPPATTGSVSTDVPHPERRRPGRHDHNRGRRAQSAPPATTGSVSTTAPHPGQLSACCPIAAAGLGNVRRVAPARRRPARHRRGLGVCHWARRRRAAYRRPGRARPRQPRPGVSAVTVPLPRATPRTLPSRPPQDRATCGKLPHARRWPARNRLGWPVCHWTRRRRPGRRRAPGCVSAAGQLSARCPVAPAGSGNLRRVAHARCRSARLNLGGQRTLTRVWSAQVPSRQGRPGAASHDRVLSGTDYAPVTLSPAGCWGSPGTAGHPRQVAPQVAGGTGQARTV